MNSREKWLVVAICILFLFGSAADWYRRTRPVGDIGTEIPPDWATRFDGGDITLVEADSIDLNHSIAEELVRLPGIGPVRAESIIRWRTENGPFEKVEDLVRVPGIGPATLERIRGELVVTAGPPH